VRGPAEAFNVSPHASPRLSSRVVNPLSTTPYGSWEAVARSPTRRALPTDGTNRTSDPPRTRLACPVATTLGHNWRVAERRSPPSSLPVAAAVMAAVPIAQPISVRRDCHSRSRGCGRGRGRTRGRTRGRGRVVALGLGGPGRVIPMASLPIGLLRRGRCGGTLRCARPVSVVRAVVLVALGLRARVVRLCPVMSMRRAGGRPTRALTRYGRVLRGAPAEAEERDQGHRAQHGYCRHCGVPSVLYFSTCRTDLCPSDSHTAHTPRRHGHPRRIAKQPLTRRCRRRGRHGPYRPPRPLPG